MKILLILLNLVLIQGYKRNFHINLTLEDDNGAIQINDIKLSDDKNQHENPQPNKINNAQGGYNDNNQRQSNEVHPRYNTRNQNQYQQRTPVSPQPTPPATNNRSPQMYNNRNARPCIMNNINCALSGANGEKLEHCLSCANAIYSGSNCNKYEPLSLLSLFSKTTYGKNSAGNSLLELEAEATDLNLEGLRPLNIKPKVSVHDLLYSYDKVRAFL
ncbi:hypothetical protein TpMuguga_04g00599 [Theileria parva strain Muguga]|uniref:Uncharacterized protein n=1 Tax=Theileria parva TaxID=5875 RepID=Q4N1X8_THEPA|nr:uncharacterized protein TpMuguga_04g00599 [Theileria parva strain Muguga]EAN31951.1 hypothetical protein TpMuguga_04g00599 [Theileria parva strain Muguga]|eukprot:XP_764234.1 hypothetical protein [Theileria parva strain Muguga]